MLFILAVLTGCTARGPLAMVPDGTSDGSIVTVYQSSNRVYGPLDPPIRGRSPKERLAKYEIHVPEERMPGTVEIPGQSIRPDRQFLISSELRFEEEAELILSLRKELSHLPMGEREVSVFVPGFNMSAAQSLARTAQLKFDLDIPGLAALFSWPSAATILGYAHDRDSVLYSRDAYERFLRAIAKSRPERMILVAHSMGALLTMETLRQISISDPSWIGNHIGGVVLISPDIDLDVFRSQAARIGNLPEPFIIFVSKRDRALALAASVSGDELRLGAVTDPSLLSGLDVTLVDISLFNSGMGHFDFGRSPALLKIISEMARLELSFELDPASRLDPISGTMLTVRGAGRLILWPSLQ